jgi:GTP:adenosylcobinamide-phosphate guanylyltransferase
MSPHTTPFPKRFTAVVLAGDRTPGDPVARAAGVCCKALSPIGGKAMILRVLDALGQSESVAARLLCGPPRVALERCSELRAGIEAGAWDWLENQATPSSSAYRALQSLGEDVPVLLTTADHALLRNEIVDDFCYRAIESGLELVVGVVPYNQVMAAHPGVRRTGWRFRDDTYCGCNLFAFARPRARRAADFWRKVEQERKHPWRVVRLLGWGSVLRYLTSRLTLAEAVERLSRRLGIRIGHVVLPFPEAALDVDTLSDWEYVRRLAELEPDDAPMGPKYR